MGVIFLDKKSSFKLIGAMLIWGSLGIFVKNIHLSSTEIAFSRAVVGSLFIFMINKFYFKKPIIDSLKSSNKKSIFILIILGLLLGLNWVFLFQSYKYTTVGNGTLIYYLAPAFTILLSPIVTKEKIKLKSLISVFVAISGLALILISNGGTSGQYNHMKGMFFALAAAVVYALIVLMNKKLNNIDDIIRTLIQMVLSIVILLPLVVTRGNFRVENEFTLVMLLFVGVVHTGFAYMLYFSSFKDVATDKIAVLSYIDPVSSVIFGAVFLSESISINTVIGGILILGSSFISNYSGRSGKVEA